jgi:protein-disulfide isomerase
MPPKKTAPKRRTNTTRTHIIEPVVEIEEQDRPEEDQPLAKETARFKFSYLYGLISVLAFAAGIFVGYMIWEYKPEPKRTIYNIETAGFPSLGPADAPVVIVEFSEYQCPYCWKWYEQVYKPLLEAYPEKIRLVFRNYPLSFHPNAVASAEAALCAGDQNAYWEFHNVLFDNYLNIYQEDQRRLLDQAAYNQFASSLGLNVVTFERCMASHKYLQLIQADVDYANSLPPDFETDETGETVAVAAVGGTPTFFINGHRLGGAYPFEAFQEIIEAELAKSK